MRVLRVVPIVTTNELSPASEVYTGMLGMTEVMNHGWIATFCDPSDARVQLSLMTQDQTAPCNPVVSIEVDDVDEAYAHAQRLGLTIVHPLTAEPWGVRRFFFQDRSGNVINVLSHH